MSCLGAWRLLIVQHPFPLRSFQALLHFIPVPNQVRPRQDKHISPEMEFKWEFKWNTSQKHITSNLRSCSNFNGNRCDCLTDSSPSFLRGAMLVCPTKSPSQRWVQNQTFRHTTHGFSFNHKIIGPEALLQASPSVLELTFYNRPLPIFAWMLPHHWHRQNATKSQTSIVQLHPPWRLAQLRKLSQVWLWSGGHHIKWFHWYREVLHHSQLSGKWCTWDWFESEWNIRRDILYIPKWWLSTNTPGMGRCGKETFSLI